MPAESVFSKAHKKQFAQMDSLNDYLEKKKDRAAVLLNTQPDKVSMLSSRFKLYFIGNFLCVSLCECEDVCLLDINNISDFIIIMYIFRVYILFFFKLFGSIFIKFIRYITKYYLVSKY